VGRVQWERWIGEEGKLTVFWVPVSVASHRFQDMRVGSKLSCSRILVALILLSTNRSRYRVRHKASFESMDHLEKAEKWWRENQAALASWGKNT